MTIKIGREDTGAATMTAIKKASESNQVRLQTLELAVAHLTNICIGLSEDVKSMRAILMDSNAIRGEGKEAVTEIKLPYYSKSNSSSLSSDSKDDLGVKKVAKQLGRKPLASPAVKPQGSKPRAIAVKANPKEPMKPAPKGTRPAATASHKGPTGSTKADPIKNIAPPAKTNPTAVKGSSAGRSIAKNSAGTASREGQRKPADKAVARPEPVNEKGGAAKTDKAVAVKLPPHMVDAPTIRTLIYGSRPVPVAKPRSEVAPVALKKRP